MSKSTISKVQFVGIDDYVLAFQRPYVAYCDLYITGLCSAEGEEGRWCTYVCSRYPSTFLLQLKKEADSEAVKSDVVGQAYLEEAAMKLFHYADTNDRSAIFNRFVGCIFWVIGFCVSLCTIL